MDTTSLFLTVYDCFIYSTVPYRYVWFLKNRRWTIPPWIIPSSKLSKEQSRTIVWRLKCMVDSSLQRTNKDQRHRHHAPDSSTVVQDYPVLLQPSFKGKAWNRSNQLSWNKDKMIHNLATSRKVHISCANLRQQGHHHTWHWTTKRTTSTGLLLRMTTSSLLGSVSSSWLVTKKFWWPFCRWKLRRHHSISWA